MNGVGYGNYSDPTTIISDRTPLIMATPTNGSVSPITIPISWVALTGYDNTGRDPLVNYMLEYYDGATAWTTLTITGTSTFAYIHTLESGVFPCNTDRSDYYVQYRVTAANGVGYGIPSIPLMVLTNTYPNSLSPVVVTSITPT